MGQLRGVNKKGENLTQETFVTLISREKKFSKADYQELR